MFDRFSRLLLSPEDSSPGGGAPPPVDVPADAAPDDADGPITFGNRAELDSLLDAARNAGAAATRRALESSRERKSSTATDHLARMEARNSPAALEQSLAARAPQRASSASAPSSIDRLADLFILKMTADLAASAPPPKIDLPPPLYARVDRAVAAARQRAERSGRDLTRDELRTVASAELRNVSAKDLPAMFSRTK